MTNKIIPLVFVLLITWSEKMIAQDFTIGVIPDWQKLTYQGTDGAQQMKNICQWFVDHKKELNVVFVASLGDMGHGNYKDTTYSADQWNRNVEALSILRTKGIPFSPNQGNHYPYVAINKYFPVSNFEYEPYWGGSMNGKIENAYYLFETAGMEFILLNTQWAKSTIANRWANHVFDQYVGKRAIYVSHSGLSREVVNDTYLVDSVVTKHDNIFLGVMRHLCESTDVEYWTTKSKGRNTQHLIRTNYQCRYIDKIPALMLRYCTFKPKEDRVYAYTYNLRTQ